MNALLNINDNNIVVDISNVTFEVSYPFTWVECPDYVLAGEFRYENNFWVRLVRVVSSETNKVEASRRLDATDWVNQPDVYDPANTPHLTNRDAFLAYRLQVRSVAVNPAEGNIDWPTEPTTVWST